MKRVLGFLRRTAAPWAGRGMAGGRLADEAAEAADGATSGTPSGGAGDTAHGAGPDRTGVSGQGPAHGALTMPTPFDAMRSGFQVAQLAVESQAVVTMRLMGMGGAWNTPFDESYRMWREKPAAFTEAAGRAVEAAMKGQPPSAVVSAMVAPLNRDAARNRVRLSDRGLRKLR